MKQHLVLCLVCAAVYWAPVLLEIRGEGAAFFLLNGTISFVACGAYLLISQRWASLGVASLELGALMLNLACLLQFLTMKGALYGAYGAIINLIVVLQCAVLVLGAPWDGIRSLAEHLRGGFNFGYPTGLWRRLARQDSETE